MGRSVLKIQQIGSANYQTSAIYNLAGELTTETYPSNRTVANAYDSAGRTTSVTGLLGDGTSRAYATGLRYSPFGGITKEEYGTTTPLYHKTFYNIRGQMFDTRVSSVNDTWDWNRGRLIWYYSSNHAWGGSGTDNNGNVISAENWLPLPNGTLDQAQNLTQDTYSYDALNRLSAVNESSLDIVGGGNWISRFAQGYTYDQYGNRKINSAATWGNAINNIQAAVDPNTTTNKMYALGETDQNHSLIDYDSAGNQKKDYYSYSANGVVYDRTYDAENRMKNSTAAYSSPVGTQISTYSYDGDGRRVKRTVGTTETWQVYGLGGELVAEYAANASHENPQKEYGYRNGQLLITAEAPTATRTNYALASNGAIASASSIYSPSQGSGYSSVPAEAINGDRTGKVGSSTEWWNDGTQNTGPDWLQVDFNGSKTIDEIDLFTTQDNYQNPVTPTETMTFTTYGLTGFEVQYWDGATWVDVTGGNVSGNNKVWREFTFAAITTSKIRVLANASADGWSRVNELEAWTATSGDGASAQIHWLVTDQLGTPRMIFDQSGSLAGASRHDYLPFGEELFAGTGGRTTTQGYPSGPGADGVRQQFTQKERDNETGLDYFGARYYASTQGRFTSPDPVFLKKVRLTDPQRLNLFTYARNNPQKYIDPTGEDIHVALTNIVTGTATIHSETATERRNNPHGVDRVDTVNTYKMTILNDTGTKYTFSVTRDSNRNGAADQMRGNYGTDNEAPPGSYSGTWEHSNSTGWHIRVYDPNVENGGNNTIVSPDGTRRTDIEIHVGTCSEGCPLVRGNSTEGDDKSYKDAMDALIKEDRDNKKGTDIHVNIQDRNPNGQPLDEPDVPETVNGTMIITRPPDPPRRRPE